MDVFDETDHVLVVAELPGAEESGVKTEVKDDVLLISATGKDRRYQNVEWVCRRATYRAIQRAIEADRDGKKKEQGKVIVRMEDFRAALAEQANDHWRSTL